MLHFFVRDIGQSFEYSLSVLVSLLKFYLSFYRLPIVFSSVLCARTYALYNNSIHLVCLLSPR